MATPRVIRNALEKPESEPFVAPSGRFVFVPLAPNVGCGWAKVEKDRASGRLVASLSVDGRRLGYRTLEDVCDSPAAAERLRAFLKRSECRRGARLPEERLPSAVAEMRKRAKSGRPAADEAFDWGAPGPDPEPPSIVAAGVTMAGTPAGVDPDYQRRHPAWRESYHQMQRDILLQYRYDREAGKRIQVEDDRWIPSSGLSLDELQLLSERRARQILERCIRRREDVGAARTRQVTTAARGQVV